MTAYISKLFHRFHAALWGWLDCYVGGNQPAVEHDLELRLRPEDEILVSAFTFAEPEPRGVTGYEAVRMSELNHITMALAFWRPQYVLDAHESFREQGIMN